MIDTPKKLLAALVGKKCWSITAGPGTGSMASLSFGEKFRRTRPIKNPTLTNVQREFDGEFVVFIKEAFWEIGDEHGALCTSNDSNEAAGPMLSGLQRLIGQSIRAGSLIHKDLRLDFCNGLYMQMRCAGCPNSDDCYSLHYRGSPIP